MPKKLPKPIRQIIKTTSFWKDNALILRELRYFPTIIFLVILFPFLAAVFEGFGIGFLLGFLQNLVNDGEAFKTGFSWFDIRILGIEKPELERLYRISGLILISTWIRSYFNYMSRIYTRFAEIKLVYRLHQRIFEQLQALSMKFYSSTRTGAIINTLTTEINQLRQSIGSLGFILSKGATVIIYAFIALWISWPLSLLAIFLFSLSAVSLSTLNKKVRQASFPAADARKDFVSLASELVNGIRTVKAFANQDHERERYVQASQEIARTTKISAKRFAIIRPLAEGIATTVIIFMIIVSMAIFISNDILEIASLLTFLFILLRLVPALQELLNIFANLNNLQGSIDSIQQLLKVEDKPYLKNGSKQFSRLEENGIEFVKVNFGYDSDSPVLHNINLTIESEKTTALVGGSGAGKSTLADLIFRFYDPTSGQLLLNGVDLREYDVNSVRRNMAVVSQNTFIFNTTVRENIAYGSSNATDTEIYEAAQLANALSFIQELPQGFETTLGDRGVMLSGGQRQRIAIARALIKNPDVLILDEATSALDSVSERMIQSSIENLSVGRTVITIAHRLSTIAKADKVVVLEKGRIVEQGSYQELLKAQGKLWNYHQIQYEKSK